MIILSSIPRTFCRVVTALAFFGGPSAPFDTVAADQGTSAVDVRTWLAAADAALDDAIQLGARPDEKPHLFDFRTNPYFRMWLERSLRMGGNTVKLDGDAMVTFDGRPHTARTDHLGFKVTRPGIYRVSATTSAYQAKTPVTFALYRSNDEACSSEMIGVWQRDPGKPRAIVLEHPLRPGDYLYPVLFDCDTDPQGRTVVSGGAKVYQGEGGVGAEHHNLSHHGRDPGKILQLMKIEREILSSFADLLGEMKARPEGNGTLLDHTLTLFGSNLGSAAAHDPRNNPIVLAGGGLRHGSYEAYDSTDNVPLANLFVRMLQEMGLETDRFASSTGVHQWNA